MKAYSRLILLSVTGFIVTILYIIYGNYSPPVQTSPVNKVTAPYQSFIYATGIIEAESTNIPVGSSVSGVISRLFTETGQQVKIGDPLFSIDTRDIDARIELAKSKLQVARASLVKIEHQYEIDKELHQQSSGALSKRKYLASVDGLALAKANFSLVKAELALLNKELERHTVYSPISGKILQCKIRVGEFIDSSRIAARTIIVGSNKLRLRVDINENELLRYKQKTKAVAYIRNKPDLKIPLHYLYTEPSLVPKQALTGLSTERTDLRVLQALYSFDKTGLPLYVGQLLDVFIKVTEEDSQ